MPKSNTFNEPLAFDFESYARVKCGNHFVESALSFTEEKLLYINTLTLKEADFFLGLKLLLEK